MNATRVVVRVAHRWLSDAPSSSAPANVKRLAGYVVGAAKRRDLAQPEFAQALRVFADGAKHGAPVRDYATASMLVRACCTPGGAGAYVARELPTALEIFERTQARAPTPPELLAAAPLSAVAAAAAPRLQGRGRTWPDDDDGGDVEPRVCSEDGCDATPTFGSAVDGIALRCELHRRPGDEQVALTFRALGELSTAASHAAVLAATEERRLARADGSSTVDYGARARALLRLSALVCGHAIGRPDATASKWLHEARTFFLSCRRAAWLPRRETAMLERALTPLLAAGPPDVARRAINAWMFALVAVGDADAAWRAHEAGRAAGVPLDAAGANALVRASCDAQRVDRALDVIEEAEADGVGAATDPHVLCSLLYGAARCGDVGPALEAYEAAVRRGLRPDRPLLNALAHLHAKRGDIDVALDCLRDGRGLGGAAARRSRSAVPLQRERDEERDESRAVMAVLHACVAAGRHEQAFEIFAQLKLGGFAARDATILLPLMAAAKHLGEPRRARELFDGAVAAGGRPSAALLGAALIDAYADVRGAFDAFGRVAEAGAPTEEAVAALLAATVAAARPDAAARALEAGEARGVAPTDALRSLLLEAHAAAARRRRNRLPAALALYDRGRAEGWAWSLRSRRKLLGECARQGQLTPGLAILDECEANGEAAPFGIVETLFSQSHRRGVVSDEAWREWRDEGPSLEDEFRYKLD